MFRQFLQQLTQALGTGAARYVLIAGPVVLFAAILILGTRAWRRRIEVQEEAQGWRAFLAAGLANSLRLSAGLLGVGFLCLALLVQAGLYTERHGRVTQRNYDAVRGKWGVPHEQHELRVKLAVWDLVTEENFAGGGERRVVEPSPGPPADNAEEEVISDETFQTENDDKGKPKNPMAVARRVKKRERRELNQDCITAAAVKLELRNQPRYLGGAGYAGFEDRCSFDYTVANRGSTLTRAAFEFELPGQGQGFFSKLSVRLDGQEITGEVRYRNGALCWERTMPPAARHRVEVAYESRGLEYFRYCPGQLRERYPVEMRVLGIPRERLNFPIGAMSPLDDLAALNGEDYTLHWDLSRAVTNFSLGVIVPPPAQPGVEVARILREAPLGLALLVLFLVVTRLLLGARTELLPIGLAAVAHYLGYVTFAHVTDLTDSFPAAFLIGAGLPALAGAVFWIKHDRDAFAGRQSAVLYALFTVGYPLAVYHSEYTGTVLNLAYVVLIAYLMLLAVWTRSGSVNRSPASVSPAPAD